MIAGAPATSAHLVQFYDDDRSLIEWVSRFLGGGLGAGDVVIAIATERHLVEFEKLLVERGLDVAGPRAAGRYVTLDAAETLAKITLDGRPHPERFAGVIGSLIQAAAARHGLPVRIFGDMVASFWKYGEPGAAIRLEELWNELRRELPFSLVCAYPFAHFASEAHGRAFLRICADHDEVIPCERYGTDTRHDEWLRVGAGPEKHAGWRAGSATPDRAAEAGSRLAAIVESAEDAIIGKTLDGSVTDWNRAAERIFGFSAEEMIGQSISRIIPPDRREDLPMILEAVRRGERVDHYETERLRKDGCRIFVSLTVSPIREASGRIIGISKIARDVTERRRMDAQREQLIDVVKRSHAELEAANRAKDDFLAMLGHELRNPVAAVRNALESGQLDPTLSERALQLGSRQARRLSRLVDDLLDVARTTHGGVRLNRETTVLAEILQHAVESTQFLLERQAHTLSLALPSDAVCVDCDPLRLEQVLVNLLNNAAKYTPPGGRIEVSGEQEKNQAVVRVRDNGLGIAADALPRIFEPFVRAPNERDRTGGGLGVGLTVARNFVVLHGGTIEAVSQGPGTGAEFVVRLPLAAGAVGERAATPAPDAPQVGGVRIVVVDDDPDVGESVAMLLGTLGHQVRIAGDGPTALEAARAEAPAIMLVDIGLPGMDGYEVARRVRQSAQLREIVLVALTGYGLEEVRTRARAAGFDHCLTKPVAPDVLRSLIPSIGTPVAGAARDVLRDRATRS